MIKNKWHTVSFSFRFPKDEVLNKKLFEYILGGLRKEMGQLYTYDIIDFDVSPLYQCIREGCGVRTRTRPCEKCDGNHFLDEKEIETIIPPRK